MLASLVKEGVFPTSITRTQALSFKAKWYYASALPGGVRQGVSYDPEDFFQ
jgi:hypothetical protein